MSIQEKILEAISKIPEGAKFCKKVKDEWPIYDYEIRLGTGFENELLGLMIDCLVGKLKCRSG